MKGVDAGCLAIIANLCGDRGDAIQGFGLQDYQATVLLIGQLLACHDQYRGYWK
jgi:hypothetical protein